LHIPGLSQNNKSIQVFFYSILCFNFSTPITQPMHPVLRQARSGADTSASGQLRQYADTYWGAAQGTVKKPLHDVFALILDHNTTKGSKVDKMDVDKTQDPLLLARHLVHFEVHPFLFINVEWNEDWAYSLIEGTKDAPSAVLASYQKIEGTSYIRHLCGNILLRKNDEGTDVFLYEETQAKSRSQEDVVNGLIGTLKTLRAK